MKKAALAALAAAFILLSGCTSSQQQARSQLPLSEEVSSATPLPPTYVIITGEPGPFKDNSSNEWKISRLGIEYRADDYPSFHPVFDVYVEKEGDQVFNRLGIPGDAVSRGYTVSAQLELTNQPVFIGYDGEYLVRVQMRRFRGYDVNYTAVRKFGLG